MKEKTRIVEKLRRYFHPLPTNKTKTSSESFPASLEGIGNNTRNNTIYFTVERVKKRVREEFSKVDKGGSRQCTEKNRESVKHYVVSDMKFIA